MVMSLFICLFYKREITLYLGLYFVLILMMREHFTIIKYFLKY